MQNLDLIRKKIMQLVQAICGTTQYIADDRYPDRASPNDADDADCPTDASYQAAMELLRLIGVESGKNGAYIFEIPLCWSNQVCIRYTMGDFGRNGPPWSRQMFDVFAGVSADDSGEFFFQICWEPYEDNPFHNGLAFLFDYACPLSDFLTGEEIVALGQKRKPDEIPVLHWTQEDADAMERRMQDMHQDGQV